MTSENYRQLLNNAYSESSPENMTDEEFDDTLMHFAMLFSKEQSKQTVGEGEVSETEYGVDSEKFAEVMPVVEPRLKDGDKVSITTTESTDKDEDTSEVDSLYSGADDRAIEYGIQNEEFDKLMEELKTSGRPTIKVTESINPRIKKGDLINYIKNKK